MTTTTEEEFTSARVVYMGARVLNDGTLGESYIPEERLLALMSLPAAPSIEYGASRFGGKKLRGSPDVVGGVYEVPCVIAKDGELQTLKPVRAKFVESIGSNPDLVGALALMRAEDDLSRKDFRARTYAKNRKDNTEEAISKLKWVYRNLSPNLRNAFKLDLLNQLDSIK